MYSVVSAGKEYIQTIVKWLTNVYYCTSVDHPDQKHLHHIIEGAYVRVCMWRSCAPDLTHIVCIGILHMLANCWVQMRSHTHRWVQMQVQYLTLSREADHCLMHDR
jgi:hypothetical protein